MRKVRRLVELCGWLPPRLTRRGSQAVWMALAVVATLALHGCSTNRLHANDGLLPIARVRRLAMDSGDAGVMVHVRGVVTFLDALTHDFIIQDETGALHAVAGRSAAPSAGQLVEGRGLVRMAGPGLMMLDPIIRPLGPAPPPVPDRVDFSEPDLAKYINRRVIFKGVAESWRDSHPNVKDIVFRTGNSRVSVRAPDYFGNDAETFLDADLEVTGVLARLGKTGDSAQPYRVWSKDLRSIVVRKPAKPTDSLPVISSAEALGLASSGIPEHRIRLRGQLTLASDGILGVKDAVGIFPVHLGTGTGLGPGSDVDLAGYLAKENGGAFLDAAIPAKSSASQDTLVRTARELHGLSPRRAAFALPIRLEAIVTYVNWTSGIAFVQDSTDATFVQLSQKAKFSYRRAQVGDLAEVTGLTDAGGFAPIVNHGKLRFIRKGTLPQPEPDTEEALSGQRDCRWAAFGGVVQSVRQDSFGTSVLHLTWGTHSYFANVFASDAETKPLINRTVYLEGPLGAIFNQNRQFESVQIFVPGMKYIRVKDTAASDSGMDLPRPAISLLQFSQHDEMGHRLRFRGVVTLANENGPTWIRDNSGALLIEDHNRIPLERGDLVDASGFPQSSGTSPVITSASVQKIKSGLTVDPIPISAEQATDGSFNGHLVSMDGTIVSSSIVRADRVVNLQSGPYLFDARLPVNRDSEDAASTSELKAGAKLRVTGICSLSAGHSKDPWASSSFELLVRSSRDLTILKKAHWLTLGRLSAILAVALVVVLIAVGWILVLRRIVRTQTRKLTESLKRTREAESLEQDRKAILELVARDEPIDRIMNSIADVITRHIPGTASVIQVELDNGSRISASSGMPERLLFRLSRLKLGSIKKSSQYSPTRHLSDDPQWGGGLDAEPLARYQAFAISRDGKEIGVIAVLSPRDLADHPRGEEIIESACQLAGLAAQRRDLYEQLSFRAKYDEMTSLLNRASLYERMAAELSQCARESRKFGVLYIDLDGFKSINDKFGHDAGDAVLRKVADSIRMNLHHTDICARAGGDEFVVGLPGIENRREVERVAELLNDAIREAIPFRNQDLHVGASVGISLYPDDGGSCEALLKAADDQMYRCKRAARDYDLARK